MQEKLLAEPLLDLSLFFKVRRARYYERLSHVRRDRPARHHRGRPPPTRLPADTKR